MESHLEARLWNDIFVAAQRELGIPQGTIKATVLIETVLAAFEMDEILHELKDHSAGLNIGRWDYIFSCIKKFRVQPRFLPRRPRAGHDDRAVHARLCAAARQDLSPARRARDGRHGRADPDQERPGSQRGGDRESARGQAARSHRRLRRHVGRASGPGRSRESGVRRAHAGPEPARASSATTSRVTAQDLLDFQPEKPITEAGLRNNISVGIQYIGAWLAGNGCVPVYNLMEDAATAEISRSQIWQWIRSPKGVLDDGRKVTRELFRELAARRARQSALAARRGGLGRRANTTRRRAFSTSITTSDDYVEFLTLPGYELAHPRSAAGCARLTALRVLRKPRAPRAGLFCVPSPAMSTVVLFNKPYGVAVPVQPAARPSDARRFPVAAGCLPGRAARCRQRGAPRPDCGRRAAASITDPRGKLSQDLLRASRRHRDRRRARGAAARGAARGLHDRALPTARLIERAGVAVAARAADPRAAR